jgi:alkyl sulfatase BDS1-like metallo-beta-lactamase superfamily hydrolase
VPIIAPELFIDEATSENIIAGVTMSRRALYMFGLRLPHTERGHVGSGLGKGPAHGTFGILQPTETIRQTTTELTIDGVKFVFQNAPGSEAPAELTFYLPDLKTFCGAEVVSHNMHNLYTLRGAKVRDAVKWSGYIDEVIALFGDAEVYFGSHHWPIWGNERVVDFLEKQRDTYKYINDQALRLALHGNTPREIAEQIELPESLRTSFPSRGYYGTLKHNAKAVYQRYFGWYDGNPANLDPLPPAEAGAKYVELAGGAVNLLKSAQAAYDRGEYRWVAEVVNHLVFADPDNQDARDLLARAYDQLGYQAESGPWRDIYLTGAFELRHGGPAEGIDLASAIDMIKHAPLERFLDAMAARLNAPKAEGKEMIVNLVFTDLGESYVLELKNSVLRHYQRDPDPDANVTLRITHDIYLRMVTGRVGIKDTLFTDDLKIEGSRLDLVGFFRLFDKPDGTFNIVTP